MPAAAPSIAFCAAVMGASIAHGQLRFDARVDGWRIANLATSCLAFNRPADEFNAAPYNALSFALARDGALRFRVHFWPRAFKEGDGRALGINFSGGASFALKARSADGFSLETDEPVTPEFRRALGGNAMLAATAEGIGTSLAFNVERVGQVLTLLGDCARMLPERP